MKQGDYRPDNADQPITVDAAAAIATSLDDLLPSTLDETERLEGAIDDAARLLLEAAVHHLRQQRRQIAASHARHVWQLLNNQPPRQG